MSALLAAGIVTGVVRLGVGSAGAGVFHGPVCEHSPVVADCNCEALSVLWLSLL